jgi:hypothetical protein
MTSTVQGVNTLWTFCAFKNGEQKDSIFNKKGEGEGMENFENNQQSNNKIIRHTHLRIYI